MEESQKAGAKESQWTHPPQPLLSASPWSIVLPLLQVGFPRIVITVRFSKGYSSGMLGSGLGQDISGCHQMFLCFTSAAVLDFI